MDDIKTFIRQLNKIWQDKEYAELYNFFDQNVLMLLPGSTQIVKGVDEMVESFRQFNAMSKIHSFNVTDITSFEFDDTIICHMPFSIDYEIESGRYQEKGMEIYTIMKTDVSFKIIWRTQISLNS
ncbi:MAG: hypothetical protein H6627_01130 [Calditrichae bacterium]|nr:hypothetical protein [Calditrichia bacterium]